MELTASYRTRYEGIILVPNHVGISDRRPVLELLNNDRRSPCRPQFYGWTSFHPVATGKIAWPLPVYTIDSIRNLPSETSRRILPHRLSEQGRTYGDLQYGRYSPCFELFSSERGPGAI